MSTILVRGRSIIVERATLGRRPGAIVPDQRHDLAARLDVIEERLNRLTISRRNPDRFHEQKSDIADDIRKLASELRG